MPSHIRPQWHARVHGSTSIRQRREDVAAGRAVSNTSGSGRSYLDINEWGGAIPAGQNYILVRWEDLSSDDKINRGVTGPLRELPFSRHGAELASAP